MSCVFRVSALNLEVVLANVSIKPYRLENRTAHFNVSDAEFEDLARQTRDAIAFLRDNSADLTVIMSAQEASGGLDFAVDVRAEGFQFKTFDRALIRLAGELGLDITMSLYPSGVTANAAA